MYIGTMFYLPSLLAWSPIVSSLLRLWSVWSSSEAAAENKNQGGGKQSENLKCRKLQIFLVVPLRRFLFSSIWHIYSRAKRGITWEWYTLYSNFITFPKRLFWDNLQLKKCTWKKQQLPGGHKKNCINKTIANLHANLLLMKCQTILKVTIINT